MLFLRISIRFGSSTSNQEKFAAELAKGTSVESLKESLTPSAGPLPKPHKKQRGRKKQYTDEELAQRILRQKQQTRRDSKDLYYFCIGIVRMHAFPTDFHTVRLPNEG